AIKQAITPFDSRMVESPYSGFQTDGMSKINQNTPRPSDNAFCGRFARSRSSASMKTLADAHSPLAFIKGRYQYDWAFGGEREFCRAIELEPRGEQDSLGRSHLEGSWTVAVRRVVLSMGSRTSSELQP